MSFSKKFCDKSPFKQNNDPHVGPGKRFENKKEQDFWDKKLYESWKELQKQGRIMIA